MKISAAEAQWDTCQPCAFSLVQVGGFTEDDQTPTFSIQIPHALSWVATGSLDGEVQGLTESERSTSGVRAGQTTCRRCGRSTGACA